MRNDIFDVELKEQKSYCVLGLMSGTSLDGLDLCLTCFEKNDEGWHFEIVDSSTVPYKRGWTKKLKKAHKLAPGDLSALDKSFGAFLGRKSVAFLKGRKVDLVASHGHTVFHEPAKGITHQIGAANEMVELLGVPVIHDFRIEDVELGGQGAPLVPIGDRELFSDYAACLNLGGFANTSFEYNGQRIAYDICAVNFVMNRMVKKRGLKYDDGGSLARSGTVRRELFEQLNRLPFFGLKHPKSLGREWVKAKVRPLIKEFKELSVEDQLATFCEHIAFQIGSSLKGQPEVLVTGGGAFNTFLMERIEVYLPDSKVIVPSPLVIDSKEALVFAFLGLKRALGEVNVLSSVTGASKDHCAGIIEFPEGENKIEFAN